MRKLFIFWAAVLMTVVSLGAKANETGHFFVDLRASQVRLSDLTSSFGTYAPVAEGSTFELFRDTTDHLGMRHLSYQQYYQGVKVKDHMILVHARDGIVQYLHGHVLPQVVSPSPSRIKQQAGERMLLLHQGKYHHVYRVSSRATLEMLYVDVETGELVYAESALREADMTVHGMTRYYGSRAMTVNERDGKYYLEDSARMMFTMSARGIEPSTDCMTEAYFESLPDSVKAVLKGQTTDVSLITAYMNRYVYGVMAQDYIDHRALSVYSMTPDLDFSAFDSVTPREYCDIHWGMQQTIDFYRTTFGRNSFDGRGYPVYNLAFPSAHPNLFPNMPGNAAAQCRFEPFYMFYGEGDGVITRPVVSLDVMAHEFTHMVTARNGNGDLAYQGESGALNESFSDCMAMGVMQFTFDTCRWTIGEEVALQWPNIRDMADPNNSRGAAGDSAAHCMPDTYHGHCWWDTSNPTPDNDMGGVHVNSGVQNHWFYLLCEGDYGINDLGHAFSVNAIGMNRALQIVYRNLIFYLTPRATFEDARQGALCAATDLYGFESPEYISVMNAWYAVGVGDPYSDQQGIEQITNTPSPSTRKIIQGGQLLIERNGARYDITGKKL